MDKAYDPLDYENLAKSIVTTLLQNSPIKLLPDKSFEGAGVYAIYYKGDFKAYKKVSSSRFKIPIYVGKAIPTGGRKGQTGISPSSGTELYRRLREHSKSITQAGNLRIEDFACRYLVVLPVWVNLAEQFLLSHYKPIWNLVLEGFGDHDPGKGRKDMRKPRWDIVHPGRPWAERLAPEEESGDLLVEVQEFLENI